MREHLVGFDQAEDLEESPTEAIAAQFDLRQEYENAVFNRDYIKIVERENEEREKIAKKQKRFIKTYGKTR